MKKFFKILRKIIKILLKIILWLILGIIVISGIILLIINNKTLKFYKNDDGNMRFTMSKDFKVEYGTELVLHLREGTIIGNEINDGEIDNKHIIKINLKEGIITHNGMNFEDPEIPGGYIDEENIVKLKFFDFKGAKQAYKNGEIEDWFEILKFFADGEDIEYYDNGQISDKIIYVNGLENGPHISYFKNGQIKEEGNYKDGEGIGIGTGYYINGNIEYIGYVENEDTLVMTGYYDNGNIKYILNTNYGYNRYYENGNLYEEFSKFSGAYNGNGTGYYIDGNIFYYFTGFKNLTDNYSDSNYTYFDKNGEILGNYESYNSGLFIDMYGNGQIKGQGNLINGENDGYRVVYFKNGKIANEGFFENGKKIGVWTGYYEDGKIFDIAQYIDENNSLITYYDENGEILGNLIISDYKTDGLYINYKINGLYIGRHTNGQIMEKGNYINSKLNGYRVEYYEDEKIYCEGNYDNGKRVGTRNWYLGDGSIGVSKNYDEQLTY